MWDKRVAQYLHPKVVNPAKQSRQVIWSCIFLPLLVWGEAGYRRLAPISDLPLAPHRLQSKQQTHSLVTHSQRKYGGNYQPGWKPRAFKNIFNFLTYWSGNVNKHPIKVANKATNIQMCNVCCAHMLALAPQQATAHLCLAHNVLFTNTSSSKC